MSQEDYDGCRYVEILSHESYRPIEAKLVASVSWLITKVYGTNAPDVLSCPCYADEQGNLHLKPSVIYSLTSGELYCSASVTIFRDPAFLNQNHSVVLQALKRLGHIVEDHERQDVTETILRQTAPFKENAHLALIDALMITSIRETVSIKQIVETIKQHANVHAEEQPHTLEEALLLWMNKICFVLSDRMKVPNSVPPMTDFYDDLCNGMCLAATMSFYNGAEMKFQRICFNEPMSIADCMHNLHLVENFCHRVFQPTLFHFGRCEDILYSHECLKINILIFIVELFYKLEEFGGNIPAMYSKSSRRHFSRADIPDLRSLDKSTFKSPVNRPTKLFQHSSSLVRKDSDLVSSAATSMMNSTDSLMTTRSFDSLKYQSCPTTINNDGMLTPHATTFADFAVRTLDKKSPEKSSFNKTENSTKPPSWAIRMQLQEKRRQIEASKGAEIGDKLQQKQQMSKEAFLKLYGKQADQASSRTPKRPLSALSSAESETDTVRSSDTDTAVTTIARTPNIRTVNGESDAKNSLILEISESIKDMKLQMQRLAEEQQQIQRKLASSVNLNKGLACSTSSAPISFNSPSRQMQQEQGPSSPCYWADQAQTTNSPIKEDSFIFVPPEPISRKKYAGEAVENTSRDRFDMTPLKAGLTRGRSVSPNSTIGYVIGEERKEDEITKLKDAVVASALKRKAMLEKRFDAIENESIKKSEEMLRKEEMDKEKKREKELHRQKIYEQYMKRKAEKEAQDCGAIRSSSSNTRLNATLTVRPVSQIIPINETYTVNKCMTNSVDNIDQSSFRSQNPDLYYSNLSVVANEPTSRLFVKLNQKSNRNLIINALEHCLFPGQVNKDKKLKCLEEFAKSDSKHFLVLFRDQKCQFRAIYSWNQTSINIQKLYGLGPNVCSEQMLQGLFKYDSGAKAFNEIPARHFSANTDGFTIKEEYWSKKKPLYSKSSTMK